eukprot:5498608-Pleurochrysis_carterae.AAC.1
MARARLYMREDRANLINATVLSCAKVLASVVLRVRFRFLDLDTLTCSSPPGRGSLRLFARRTRSSRSLSVVPFGSSPSRRFSLVDTCITLGDTQEAKEKKGDSGGEKRSDKITY